MKKIIAILLGLCFVIPAVMAAEVSDINKRAWLSHIKEMNDMRRQIIELNNKENKTAEDMAAYNDLMVKFDAKQAAWDEYIAAVANDDEEGRAKVENNFKGERHHPRFHKDHKCHKEEKCGECPKAQKCEKPCCKKAEKCEKKCMKADKCCGKCPKAEKCEKPCCKKAEKCEKKCVKEEKCGECPKAHKHPKHFKKNM
ncbi:MAG: hypothetical protein J6Z11_07195 [Candidatus Riflebacteria bacterium]|nr:hypothetical protein [Candidatus Riflebacteria bacterium]